MDVSVAAALIGAAALVVVALITRNGAIAVARIQGSSAIAVANVRAQGLATSSSQTAPWFAGDEASGRFEFEREQRHLANIDQLSSRVAAKTAEADELRRRLDAVAPGDSWATFAARPEPGGGRADSVQPEFSRTPRNAPCPCGSGKKFKLCHGAEAEAARLDATSK